MRGGGCGARAWTVKGADNSHIAVGKNHPFAAQFSGPIRRISALQCKHFCVSTIYDQLINFKWIECTNFIPIYDWLAVQTCGCPLLRVMLRLVATLAVMELFSSEGVSVTQPDSAIPVYLLTVARGENQFNPTQARRHVHTEISSCM